MVVFIQVMLIVLHICLSLKRFLIYMRIHPHFAKSGMLLLEALVACAFMSIMALYIMQYQWHMYAQSVKADLYARMLLYSTQFFECGWAREARSGSRESPIALLEWHKLPLITKDSVALYPIRVTVQSKKAAAQSYVIISAADNHNDE